MLVHLETVFVTFRWQGHRSIEFAKVASANLSDGLQVLKHRRNSLR